MKRVSLKVVGGVHNGRLIPLPVGNFLVGREQDCQLRPQSDLVSRHHCVFKVDEYGARLRDLGSTNGTFVNGIRLSSPVTLNDTDKVVIGDLEFKVVAEDAAPVGDSEVNAAVAALENETVDSGADTILEVAQTGDTNAGGETVVEMPAFDPNANVDTETFANADSTPVMPAAAPDQAPAAPPEAPPAVAPQMPAPVAPMPQQYPQQPQYNPYGQPGYPQPQMYPQPMPMGYPQQMPYQQQPMPYPQQPYPQQPMPPQQPMQQQQPAAEPAAAPVDDLDVTLPPPDETGAKEVAAKKGSAGAGVNKDDPSSHAASIIKQMQGHRPPG